jgi:hypothetical protein
MPSESGPFEFGDVVLVPFPFTSQTTSKQRPAVILSALVYNRVKPDIVLMDDHVRERHQDMQSVTFDAEAGQVSAELDRRGIPAGVRVHVSVNIIGKETEALPMAIIAQAGGAFDWLADEPDLYTDADLMHRAG